MSGIDFRRHPNAETELIPFLERVNRLLAVTGRPEIDPVSGGYVASDSHRGSASEDKEVGKIMDDIFGDSFGNIHYDFGVFLDTHQADPVRSLATWGQNLIGGAIGVMTAYALLRGAAEGADGAAEGAGILGAPFRLGTSGVSGILNAIQPIIIGMFASVVMLGGLLAYYLPAVPFIFWMFGVLGWMMLIVESLVAAPLWAVSHAVPEGEGFAGRYAMQGWQLFANVIFRPILLVLGLLLSMFMLHFIARLAIYGYSITNLSIVTSTSWSSILSFVFGNMVLVGLVLTLAHKSHEMIYETADNVMRWLGFGVHPLGEVKGETSTHGAFKSGVNAVGSASAASMAKHNAHPGPGAGTKGGTSPVDTDRMNPEAPGRDVNAGKQMGGNFTRE